MSPRSRHGGVAHVMLTVLSSITKTSMSFGPSHGTKCN